MRKPLFSTAKKKCYCYYTCIEELVMDDTYLRICNETMTNTPIATRPTIIEENYFGLLF